MMNNMYIWRWFCMHACVTNTVFSFSTPTMNTARSEQLLFCLIQLLQLPWGITGILCWTLYSGNGSEGHNGKDYHISVLQAMKSLNSWHGTESRQNHCTVNTDCIQSFHILSSQQLEFRLKKQVSFDSSSDCELFYEAICVNESNYCILYEQIHKTTQAWKKE